MHRPRHGSIANYGCVGFAAREVFVYGLCMLDMSLGKMLAGRTVGKTHYLTCLDIHIVDH